MPNPDSGPETSSRARVTPTTGSYRFDILN